MLNGERITRSGFVFTFADHDTGSVHTRDVGQLRLDLIKSLG